MVKDKSTQWPYFFCPQCVKLAPVQFMSSTRFCLRCAYTYDKLEGGRLVLLSRKEARMRRLDVIKDETTGELE